MKQPFLFLVRAAFIAALLALGLAIGYFSGVGEVSPVPVVDQIRTY